jgi:transcriptional regulator of arginine metabolism
VKTQRQQRILELVSKHEIETQEEMMSRLQSEGFKVTQATVSRDLKELKLTKTLTARGTYRYAVNAGRQHTGTVKFNNAMVVPDSTAPRPGRRHEDDGIARKSPEG